MHWSELSVHDVGQIMNMSYFLSQSRFLIIFFACYFCMSSLHWKAMTFLLQNDFHLMSSFDKTKYIFDPSIWECNGHFDH